MNVDFEPHEDLEIIGIPCLTCATKHLYDRTVEPDSGLGCSRHLRQISQRTISTASRRQFENRVAEKQKLFQEDNGIPVHLKGGVMDSLLYKVTMGLTVFGTAYVIYELLVASMPKKQK
nr:PREDICTED: cytochrome c oxidase subunit 7A2, mitochondrial [Opisthocomus hoazin]